MTKKTPQAYHAYDFPQQKFRFRWPQALAKRMPTELEVPLPEKPQAIDPEAVKHFDEAQKQLERVKSRACNLLKGPCDFVLVTELPEEGEPPAQTEMFA